MKDVLWIAVDERDCDGAAVDVARMLVAGGGAFAAVALEVDGAADHLEDVARSLSRQFQVAVVPLICAERLAREPDQVMQGVDALVRSGSLRTAAFGRAVMLVRANALRLPRLVTNLRADSSHRRHNADAGPPPDPTAPGPHSPISTLCAHGESSAAPRRNSIIMSPGSCWTPPCIGGQCARKS